MSEDSAHAAATDALLPKVMLLVGVAIGFGATSFAVIIPWAAAAVVAVVALVLDRNKSMLFLALGLALGGFAAIALGMFWNLIDDPSSASGGS